MSNVAFTHPEYAKNILHWQKCRDTADGENAIKAGGELYLPRLRNQADDDYLGYLRRGSFFGATGRTIKGLMGAISRKPAEINFPASKKDLLQKLTPDGEPIELIIQQVLEEVLAVGRVGVLVDAPADGDGDPYVSIYYAENIINWRENILPDESGILRKKLTLLVLVESVYVTEDPEDYGDDYDPYSCRLEKRFRVLTLNPDGKGYLVQVYTQDERPKKAKASEPDTYTLLEEYEPKARGGVPFTEIPFTFINPNGTGVEVDKPPLLDLVNVNLAHWINSCDLEHGRHLTALPTPWVVGFEVGASLYLGSGKAWVSENPAGRCGFLEFSGAGLQALVVGMEAKEAQMAVLGGRLLEERPSQPESGVAINLRQSGEKSALSSIARSCSEGLTKIIKWVALWAGLGEKVDASLLLNQDYNISVLDGRSLTAFLAAVQAGKMSFTAWFNLLKQADAYPDEWEESDEIAAIEQGGPQPEAGQVVAGNPANPNQPDNNLPHDPNAPPPGPESNLSSMSDAELLAAARKLAGEG